jgi:hypothetical protein
MNYPEFMARLANTAVYDVENDPDFQVMAPQALQQAENRILRELDPIIFRARRSGMLTVADGGQFDLASMGTDIVCAREVWLFLGQWVRLARRDPSFLRLYEPNAGAFGTPKYWGTIDGVVVEVCGVPPLDVAIDVDLTFRPPGMSEANPVTWLGTWVPELLFAAAMVFACGFQRSYGEAQASGADGISWEAQYKALFAGAAVEARRRKGDGPFDNSMVPAVSSIAPT